MASISGHVSRCLRSLVTLLETVEFAIARDDDTAPSIRGISAPVVNDHLARFKIWAGNTGAHRTGRSSLDYRLRDASNLHRQACRLLENLAKLVGDGRYFCRSIKPTSTSPGLANFRSSDFNLFGENDALGQGATERARLQH